MSLFKDPFEKADASNVYSGLDGASKVVCTSTLGDHDEYNSRGLRTFVTSTDKHSIFKSKQQAEFPAIF